MLFAVGQHFRLIRQADQSSEDYAVDCGYKLRDFVKGQTEAVKHSRQLQDKTKELVKFFDNPFKTPQDFAEFLMALLGVERESNSDVGCKSAQLLKDLLDDFAKVENARRYELEQSWLNFTDRINDKTDLLRRLSDERATPRAKAVAHLLGDNEPITAQKITHALLHKAFEQCSDMDIGKCQDGLENLLDYHPPIPPPPPQLPKPLVINEPAKIFTTDNLIRVLRQHIESTQLPRTTIKQTLQQLLNDYEHD